MLLFNALPKQVEHIRSFLIHINRYVSTASIHPALASLLVRAGGHWLLISE